MRFSRKKCTIGFMAILFLLSLCACTSTNNTTHVTDNSNTPITNNGTSATHNASTSDVATENLMAQIKNATLQYPSSNDEWKYNVYDSYIELTRYIGPKVNTLTIPSELEGLPVWSLNTGRIYSEEQNTLTSVKFSDGLLVIGNEVFRGCIKLKSLTFPDTLASIGDSAFENASLDQSSLSLPEGLQTIGEKAFDGIRFHSNSVPTILVPASVKKIGYAAFRGIHRGGQNGGLSYGYEITVLNENVQLGDACFESATVVYGRAGSTVAQYCADHNKTFKLVE